MRKNDVSYVVTNNIGTITGYNDNFASCYLHNQLNPEVNINETLQVNLTNELYNINLENNSVLLIRNAPLPTSQDFLNFLYIRITKQENLYQLKITNWLNWLHQLYTSMDAGYSLMTNINNSHNNLILEKISDIYCFNALYPLLMHMPRKHISCIDSSAFYDVFRIFVNRKNNNEVSKDYSRNIYSRLKTSIKEETGMSNMHVADIMRQNSLLNCSNSNGITMKHTKTTENILIPEFNDNLLNMFLDNLHFLDVHPKKTSEAVQK